MALVVCVVWCGVACRGVVWCGVGEYRCVRCEVFLGKKERTSIHSRRNVASAYYYDLALSLVPRVIQLEIGSASESARAPLLGGVDENRVGKN